MRADTTGRGAALAVATVLVVGAAACGDDDDAASDDAPTTEQPAAAGMVEARIESGDTPVDEATLEATAVALVTPAIAAL